MNHLDLVKLPPLMELTSGGSEVVVELLDGPVATNHPDLANENIREIPGSLSSTCTQNDTAACMHGTFVAGILCAKWSQVKRYPLRRLEVWLRLRALGGLPPPMSLHWAESRHGFQAWGWKRNLLRLSDGLMLLDRRIARHFSQCYRSAQTATWC